MGFKYLFIVLATAAIFSCSKDGVSKAGIYLVSASKMIGIKSNNWSEVEPQLKSKTGYKYSKSSDNLSNIIKAEVHLPAIDDSNRTVNGKILLNIAPDNRIFHAAFDTGPLFKTEAYAMMLNYNKETLKTITNITFSIGEIQENGRGRNDKVDVVLSKLNSGQDADQLGITYRGGQGEFTMVVFRQTDGRYIFSYR
jgi:hypothetical protein